MPVQLTVWVISDDSHRAMQAMAVAERLNPRFNTITVAEIEMQGLQRVAAQTKPDVIISCGTDAAPYNIACKQMFQEQAISVSVLDPGADHALFDVIAHPSHEPKPASDNLFLTTGYINKVNPERLARAKKDAEAGRYGYLTELGLKAPYYTVLIGGSHVGDDVTKDDVLAIATWLNERVKEGGGSVMATTSPRTSFALAQTLAEHLEAPHFIYDFKTRIVSPNPYAAMLTLADHIIVTGDSARMMSEACSSGKKVWLYAPAGRFFQYQALHEALIAERHAAPFEDFGNKPTFELGLNEAERLANHIHQLVAKKH